MNRKLSGYLKSISEATGETDFKILEEIEEIMRNDVFHSTLDWIQPDQFAEGARTARDVFDEIEKLKARGEWV